MKVAVVMGSKSDYPKLEEGIKLLEKYGIEVVARALSAHRTPEQLSIFLKEIEDDTYSQDLSTFLDAMHMKMQKKTTL